MTNEEFEDLIMNKRRTPYDRPYKRPGQVTDANQLQHLPIGTFILCHNKGNQDVRLIFKGLTSDNKHFLGRYAVNPHNTGDIKFSLADSGVIPYESGIWNQDNWMEIDYNQNPEG